MKHKESISIPSDIMCKPPRKTCPKRGMITPAGRAYIKAEYIQVGGLRSHYDPKTKS